MSIKIYTGGTFDLFHFGHVEFLRKCSSFGDVTVSLNTDEFIASYKGSSPVMTYEERKLVLESCKYVSRVVENIGGKDSKIAIEACGDINVIAIGSDWAKKDYYSQMSFDQDWLDSKNIGLLYLPYTPGISTTDIKKRMY